MDILAGRIIEMAGSMLVSNINIEELL